MGCRPIDLPRPWDSIYNFRQSVEDGATVPLYYENRIPELQLTNEDLNNDMQTIIEAATLDDEQERTLERQCAREYQLIVRDDRLEKIAEDLVQHFLGRVTKLDEQGKATKAMMVAIDRFTAVRMHDKVRKYWAQALDHLKVQLTPDLDELEQRRLRRRIQYMEETDMAVVVSSSQGEIEDFENRGLDIATHRRRLVSETPGLDEQFKDPQNPLRIVFVCAMWITGFDVPSCATIYLDKPMRNHTLMQTIARANRVFRQKLSGLIVDYIGVFRNLQEALAIYGSGAGGGISEGDTPVKDKAALIEQLRGAITETLDYCEARGIDINKIHTTQNSLVRTRLWDEAVDALLESDETKRTFFAMVGYVCRLYDAVCPDVRVNEFTRTRAYLERLVQKIQIEINSIDPMDDVDSIMNQVSDLLDESIETEDFITLGGSSGRTGEAEGRYVIRETSPIDLNQLDFEALAERFNKGYKRTEAEKLKGTLNAKLQKMVRLNRTRMDYLEKFQQMIEKYNAGSHNVEALFREMLQFAQTLQAEDKRALAEQLSEEELAVFDLLTKPDLQLTPAEKDEVKQIAKELLVKLKQEKLVLDWRKRQQAKAAVQVTIRQMLDSLPETYSDDQYWDKCQEVYQHVYESYYGEGRSIYDNLG